MEENDLVLCTVERIERTTVFVEIEGNGEGTIAINEIAPGRIRNLRDYVIPGKRIVCKILKISHENIYLSLRRVSEKEKRGVLEKYEKEKNALSILKSVIKENAEKTIEEIKGKEKSLYNFLQLCKESPKKLEKYLVKEEVEKICKIFKEKKEKKVEVAREFSLKGEMQNSITIVKKILMPYKNNVNYLAAGRFMLKVKAENYKSANQEMQKIISEIEEKAKKEGYDFSLKK